MPDPTHQNPTPAPGASGSPGTPQGTPHSPADRPEVSIFSLGELDGQALDALLAARAGGAERGPVPAGLGERCEKVRELLALLDRDPAQDPPGDLTARTLEAIRAHEQRQRFTRQVQMLAEPRRTLGVAWHQLAAAAAVFIIGASLLIPVMDRQQADSRRIAGAANLGMAGQAMSSYAADNLGQMPRGNVRPGMVWLEIGRPQSVNGQGARSNSAHLYKLIRLNYISAENLVCPENSFAGNARITPDQHDWIDPQAVPFSYQNQYTTRMLKLEESPTMAVLADRNPLYEFDVQDGQIVFNPSTPKNAPSRAHRRSGQNILTADGIVTWRVRPVLDPFGSNAADNIWVANGIDFYTGNETTTDPHDSFLVP